MKSRSIAQWIWAILLFLLPFTSLPLAARILRSQMVAAPSILFLILLAILWFLPFVFRNKLKDLSLPLVVFFAYCLLNTAITSSLGIPVQKDFSAEAIIFESYVTLIIGVSFFLVPLHFIQSDADSVRTQKVIYISFIPLFLWSVFQFLIEQFSGGYPEWLVNIQSAISTSGLLYPGRVTGFAFEPSWLAHQLNILFIPLFLGASISGCSISKRRFLGLSLDNLFLLGAVILLFLSKSRIGWISFIFVVVYVLVQLNRYLVIRFRQRYVYFQKRLWTVMIPIIIVIAYLISIAGGLFILSKIDSRMEHVFNPQTYHNRDFIEIANDFFIAERILYWQAGWEMFNDHPILGTGLGNYGFYFPEYMPAFASVLDEPRDLLFRADYQANNKNLWTRLLSETGITGFILFVSWLLVLWFLGRQMLHKEERKVRMWGHVLKIVLIAMIFEGFSIDSFALPYFWIMLGISSANGTLFPLHEKSVKENDPD